MCAWRFVVATRFPSTCRTTWGRTVITAVIVSVVILPASVSSAQELEAAVVPLDLEVSAACTAAVEPQACVAVDAVPMCVAEVAPTPAADAGQRSLLRAAESRVTREDASRQSFSLAIDGLALSSERPRSQVKYSGHAWPFAVGATADALSTYFALQRGGFERNPLLSSSGFDVAMAKMVQFPLLALAAKEVEKRNPRMGRTLRWATLAFHAALA